MRNAARLIVVAAFAAAVAVPAAPANAVYCGTLDPVCDALCKVGRLVGAECLA